MSATVTDLTAFRRGPRPPHVSTEQRAADAVQDALGEDFDSYRRAIACSRARKSVRQGVAFDEAVRRAIAYARSAATEPFPPSPPPRAA